MDTKRLENFAKTARSELLVAVEARLSTVLAGGSVARSERPEAVRILESEIAAHGREHVVGKVAYTWFNRLIALRFMDARGYTDGGVVSPASGQAHGQPEILTDAKRGVLDSDVVTSVRAHDVIMGLLDGSRRSTDAEGEAYSLLLTEYCRHWHKTMPFMFEAEGAYTELLVPTGLLADGALLSRAREVLTEEVCDDVEVIGWLYQFYISERKDEVFAGFKKNKKAGADEIPAATQLFTPHWIVRYLLENSLGRLWMLNRPSSRLVEQMDYYIAPIDEETDFLKVSTPEDLTVIDPACGSGHMLTYAFDLLYAIYEEQGYAPSEIPSLILTHNVHGTEIDPRAGALAAFALTMKARAKDRRFFTRSSSPGEARPNPICVIEPVFFTPDELDVLITRAGDRDAEDAFWNQFRDADTFGALIRPDAEAVAHAAAVLDGLEDHEGTFYYEAIDRARRVISQAEVLSRQYSVVTANPPYMGAKQMSALLSQFMKDEYATGKADLMTAFMLKAQVLTKPGGTWGMINLPAWMSLKSFEDLRRDLLRDQRLASMVHLGRGVFGSDFGSVAFIVVNAGGNGGRAVYRRLFEQHVDVRPVATIEALFLNRDYNRFEVAQSDFAAIPGSPIVYWLSEKMRSTLAGARTLSTLSPPRQGLSTGDNSAFTRLWWEPAAQKVLLSAASSSEVRHGEVKWVPYNKGGEFRKWYGNQEYLVDWAQDGAAIRRLGRGAVRNEDTYFRASVSWTNVSSGAPAFRCYPEGFIASASTGDGVFPATPQDISLLAGILNSTVSLALLAAVAPGLTFNVGSISGLPLPESRSKNSLFERVERLIATSREDWDAIETSWNFATNPLVDVAR
ncbi:BREX-1 system adenine-specific DNA-methyltransferase PglX [Gordonia sp. FQ]|uniref:BREX-1 system adenine-specific DNA-methyltransferase PglX n=1 Tax=Gordonia sp. FQ TaxID=3446634 RepID=UPI003F879BB0